MSFTAKELDEAVSNAEDQDYGDVWLGVYYERNNVETPFGTVEYVESWGGEGDGATIFLVVKVGDRLFEKKGYYSSWDSSSMDSDLVEVESYQEPKTYYRPVKR